MQNARYYYSDTFGELPHIYILVFLPLNFILHFYSKIVKYCGRNAPRNPTS